MATSLITVDKDLIEARINDLTAQLEEEQGKLLELQPKEPVTPGSVVRFRKYNYTWAAIKTTTITGNYRWFITQDGSRSARQGVAHKSWSELLEWIAGRNWDTIEVLS